MTDRKLATIREVAEVRPIEGADRIEAVRVDGWWLVSQKGNFKPGDLCVYFEIDSFIPVGPQYPHFEFLRKNAIKWNGYEGARIKTIKLRGQVSQGLALPLDVLVEAGIVNAVGHMNYAEGDDVTEALGIQKWEAAIPAQLGGSVTGSFPSFIPKTDQERVQNMGREFKKRLDKMPQETFEMTVKIDGSSMTVYLTADGKFGVCSRNWDLVEDPNNAFWRFVIENKIEEQLWDLKERWDVPETPFGGIAIQGELYGPGIQNNSERSDKLRWAIFDIYGIAEQRYYSPLARRMMVDVLKWEHARYLGNYVVDYSDQEAVDKILKMADGPSQNVDVKREGVVFKSVNDPTFSFKAISNQWLLSNE